MTAHSTLSVGIPFLGWLNFKVEEPIKLTEWYYDLVFGVSEEAIVKSSPLGIKNIGSNSSSL